jgi:hypothetical protein
MRERTLDQHASKSGDQVDGLAGLFEAGDTAVNREDLEPRMQRSATSAVRCRAGAHPSETVRAAWVPALRCNAISAFTRVFNALWALQRVRDTRVLDGPCQRRIAVRPQWLS